MGANNNNNNGLANRNPKKNSATKSGGRSDYNNTIATMTATAKNENLTQSTGLVTTPQGGHGGGANRGASPLAHYYNANSSSYSRR